MSNKSFYKNSFMLILSNLTTGVLGFLFSIILSRSLGAEGMGLYGLVMPIYNLFICLICGGIVTAISKISAIYIDNKDFGNVKKTIKTIFTFNIMWGIIIAFIVFLLAPNISSVIIKDSRTALALRITCPAMVFIAASNILKGYFYGTAEIMVPAIIDIFEKSVRITVILILSNMLKSKSVTSLVTVAYVALCIGEFISLILLYIYYKKSTKKFPVTPKTLDSKIQLLFNVLVISIPLCLNGFLTTALDSVCTLMLPRRLVKAGIEYTSGLSVIGKFTGMSMTIVFFPMIIIGSISTLLIPDLSQTINKKNYCAACIRIKEVLKIAILLGLCTTAICNTIPTELGYMFYNRYDLGSFIRFASICAPFVYCLGSTYGILNGISKQSIILRNSLIGAVIETSCLYVLTGIPSINIFGYSISVVLSSIIVLFLNIKEIKRHINFRFDFFQIILIFLLSILCFLTLRLTNGLLLDVHSTFKNIFIILLGFSFFFIGLIFKSPKNEYY
ncbi:stage V sporulation protein B [Clostridium frigidicarnis]|uniref:Multidrug-efflux transporter n=1 Tax=Clostridium frigidicarnis TaxID=84698 RepID=A0A1I0WVW4_9CLOT|nr:stage V sporulation protein B [Clostridium frigidicarnis]SFA92557.1 stage V sporulation protein B [Clostridium frigidicarnis]